MSENEWVVAGAYFQQKLYIHIFVTKKSTLKAFLKLYNLMNYSCIPNFIKYQNENSFLFVPT